MFCMMLASAVMVIGVGVLCYGNNVMVSDSHDVLQEPARVMFFNRSQVLLQ
jgi:hypothetical protein